MNDKVRIHLENAILVGCGDEAKYAKVLIGERSATPYAQKHARLSTEFLIFGFVRGYREITLEQPTKMLLADYNILAIAEVRVVEKMRPPAPMDAIWPWCANKHPHSAHPWTYSGSPTDSIDCPGVSKDEHRRERTGQLTTNEHAARITKLVLFCVAYNSSRHGTVLRVQEHLERYFDLKGKGN